MILIEDARRDGAGRGYVEDVALVIVLAVLDDRAGGRVYNVGEPDALTEAEWVREIGRAAGWKGEVVTAASDRLPARLRLPLNFEQHLTYDTSRIRVVGLFGIGATHGGDPAHPRLGTIKSSRSDRSDGF